MTGKGGMTAYDRKLGRSLTLMHNLICGFCSSDRRFARRLVCSPHPASFRFHLTIDTLAMKDAAVLDQRLERQREAAMAETAERYVEACSLFHG